MSGQPVVTPKPHWGTDALPRWTTFDCEQIVPLLQEILAQNRQQLQRLEALEEVSWATLMEPLEALDERLNNFWSPVSHLHAVQSTPALRQAYDQALPLLTAYHTEMGQNRALFERLQQLSEAPEAATFSQAQTQSLNHALRDFRLAGVALEGDARTRYATIKQRLAELATTFANHVLDATQGWEKLMASAEQLPGLPGSALGLLRQQAEAVGAEGWRLTLDIPAYLPVITYCEDRALREEVYRAYVSRASDQGPQAGRWDNSAIIEETLALRQELALLLGFEDYASYSLATKMAQHPDEVLGFLEDLAQRSRPVAEREFAELADFAAQTLDLPELAPWDVAYASEKLRQQRFSLSQEELRPYFPAPRVVEGLFGITAQLFDLTFRACSAELYDPTVTLYEVLRDEEVIAHFYLDLYARSGKRGGAWMADCRVRRRRGDGSLQLPVAFLTCNFTPPGGDHPALLTHDEVTTLFHEFGHGLHHMLTQVECASVSGINGVPWDAVELPSQFLENWCWTPEGVARISGHYQSGDTLPTVLLERLLAARTFQAAMQMVRQLEFSLFDFRLHLTREPQSCAAIQALLDQVRAQVAVVPVIAENRFQHGFSHIFAGGYAAGYYSYKWAEVLSADAFSLFEERGVFDAECGARFREQILEQGGSQEPMTLFIAFRGRRPTIDALLRHSGIVEEAA